MTDNRPLRAWVIRFRADPDAPVQTWTRYYRTQFEADAGTRRALYREFGLSYVVVSVALASVARQPEKRRYYSA